MPEMTLDGRCLLAARLRGHDRKCGRAARLDRLRRRREPRLLAIVEKVAELLDMSDRVRQMVLDRRPAVEIKQTAREEGMTFLRDSALEKVFLGITTLREINKVTFVQ